jgi:hypothetical protein
MNLILSRKTGISVIATPTQTLKLRTPIWTDQTSVDFGSTIASPLTTGPIPMGHLMPLVTMLVLALVSCAPERQRNPPLPDDGIWWLYASNR